MLAEEEHEQKDDYAFQLLVAQLQFERKLDHGVYPRRAVSQRCSTAHKMWPGFGSYEEPAVDRSDSLPPDDANAFAPGIACRGWLKPSAAGSQFLKHNLTVAGSM